MKVVLFFLMFMIHVPAFAGEMEIVHPELRILTHAMTLIKPESPFQIVGMERTIAEQQQLMAQGQSKTMDSLHLRQPDGYIHALDLVPIIDGKPSFDWADVIIFAEEVRDMAKILNIPIRWGGCWENITEKTEPLKVLMDQYRNRELLNGQRPLMDGLHFERVAHE